MTNLDSVLKSRDITLPTKVHIVKAIVFPVVTYSCESWKPKNWWIWTVMLEKTPESLLDSKEIKLVNLKGNQSWVLIGRADAETPVFWLSDANRQLIGKVHDSWKDQGQKEKRASVNELAGQHHQHNEYECGQTLGDGEGQGSLACCSPQGHKKSDMTGQLNNNNISSGWNLDFASLAWTIQMSCFP